MKASLKNITASLAITLVALTTCSVALAASEETCLINGKIAATTSKMMARGVSAQAIKDKMFTRTFDSPRMTRQNDMIVDYVYAMQLGEADANKMTYLRCVAGAYEQYCYQANVQGAVQGNVKC